MSVQIINGVNELNAELAGRAVSEVRGMLAQALNIDTQAQPTIDGEQVDETYSLADGDTLEFVKASGQKGC